MHQQLLFDILGSLGLPEQFTAKLLDKTVAHKAAGIATRILGIVMRATQTAAPAPAAPTAATSAQSASSA